MLNDGFRKLNGKLIVEYIESGGFIYLYKHLMPLASNVL